MAKTKNTFVELGEILQYIQPTNYIVKSTKYDDTYKIPVLTPGKSFILGYTNEEEGVFTSTPVIIFDDFTTATKFVDFSFEVKSSAMKILSADPSLYNIKYVFFMMQLLSCIHDTHKRYWIAIYSKLKIPCPLIEEQTSIANRIDALFAKLDKAEDSLQKILKQCKRYKQSLLKSAVTGELSKEWREQNPPTESGEELLSRILKERRAAWEKAELDKMTAKGKTPNNNDWKKKYKEMQKASTTDLPSLPNGWTWGTFEMLGEWSGGGTPSKANDNYWCGGIPWVSSKEVKVEYLNDTSLHISQKAIENSATKLILAGSVLFVMRSGVLQHTFPASIINVNMTINQDIKALTPFNFISSDFVLRFVQAQNRYILDVCAKDGTTVQSIEYKRLLAMNFPIPPKNEQQEICRCLFKALSGLQHVITTCNNKLKQCDHATHLRILR